MKYRYWEDYVGGVLVDKKIHRNNSSTAAGVVSWGSTFRAVGFAMRQEGYLAGNGGGSNTA